MTLQLAYYALSILGITIKRSRILTVLMLLVMWIVFGLNTYNGDYWNYQWIYQNIQNPFYWSEFEPLFNVLMYVCSIMGFDFIQFRMVFGGLFVVLLYIAISKYTNKKAEVLGLYMIFPFLYFVSVIRTGFAGLLVILAYYELITANSKIKFWVYFLVAFLFQYSSIFFVLYFFLRKLEFKKNSLFGIISVLFVAFVTYYSGLMYYLLSCVTSNYRFLKWFTPEISSQEPRWILYLIVIDLMIVFIAYLSKRENRKICRNLLVRNPYVEDVFYINVAMLVFIPTFFVTNASARFLWVILLLDYICIAKDDEFNFPSSNPKNIGFSLNAFIVIAFLLFFSYYANLPYKETEDDISLIFQNNLICDDYYQKKQ
jgi:hypothetical protein